MGDKKKKKKELKYVTLIWEEIPESIRIYVIPKSEITSTDQKALRACHLNYIGADGLYTGLVDDKSLIESSLVRLSNYLVDPDAGWINEGYIEKASEEIGVDKDEMSKIIGKWHSFQVTGDKPFIAPRSKVYRSGHLM